MLRIARKFKWVLLPSLLLAVYVISIVWRASIYEQMYFARSELIPLSLHPPKFREAPVYESFGSKTFTVSNSKGTIIVWRQKINGFQHMFGSALASYELGEYLSDKLFCANEFAEYCCDWNGVEPTDLLDRKKDLWNNRLGRTIGQEVRNQGLNGRVAEKAIADLCFTKVENDQQFLAHCCDPKVFSLSEQQLGCPNLPKKNAFNFLRAGLSN